MPLKLTHPSPQYHATQLVGGTNLVFVSVARATGSLGLEKSIA